MKTENQKLYDALYWVVYLFLSIPFFAFAGSCMPILGFYFFGFTLFCLWGLLMAIHVRPHFNH